MNLFKPTPRPHLIGVVHLLPLPGAPQSGPGLDEVIRRAVADAHTLQAGGAAAAIVENLGDAPFAADTVGPETVAALTAVVLAVRAAVPTLPLGVNVLRNDALAALSIAAVCGAAFVRVNVLTGVMATDQGLITGKARELLHLRRRLDAGHIKIAADVLVKHAVPLGPVSLPDAAHDTFHRGGADAVLITGTGTGRPTSLEDLRTVRAALPEAPLWVASGVTLDQAPLLAGLADAAVVGTALHHRSDLWAPLELSRVVALHGALTPS